MGLMEDMERKRARDRERMRTKRLDPIEREKNREYSYYYRGTAQGMINQRRSLAKRRGANGCTEG